jgi:hypothetical protein
MLCIDLCSSNPVIELPDDGSDGPKHETILIRVHSEAK